MSAIEAAWATDTSQAVAALGEMAVIAHGWAALGRSREPQVYQGHMAVVTAMAVLEAALKSADAGAVKAAAGDLTQVITDIHDEDMAAYVRGDEGGES